MWGQTTAGFLAGLPLAFLSVALLASPLPFELKTKFTLTVVFALPMYCVTITAAFAAARGYKAWGWMLAANLVCGALLFVAVQLGWYGLPEGLQ
ncbi:hypothetical protein SADO_07287 [Salinisphaera dokdonensis CL-ES53]|uniref:Uncharacterized protein n=1 Tax=Salinisphaera dokdonensis CL-ES53 TaxID=1304272 RepID=A0ABV2B0D5_9GAMM